METVDFYPVKYWDIEKQDNPAFGDTECLMVVGENTHLKSPHAVVLHIVPNAVESVNHKAKFWKHKDAVEYCEFLEGKK